MHVIALQKFCIEYEHAVCMRTFCGSCKRKMPNEAMIEIFVPHARLYGVCTCMPTNVYYLQSNLLYLTHAE